MWVGVDLIGGNQIEEPPPVVTGASSPSSSPQDEPSETPTPVATRSAEPEPKKTKSKPAQPKLITEDMTVQVLNATTDDPDADDQMADRLAGLGYDVIALGGANRVYQATTVFWSFDESRKAAERLAARFGWESGPKPSNLSTTVDIHVVVGEDFSG